MEIENKLSQIELMPFCKERIKLTEDLFHISFWSLMDIDQKIRLLQLLENNLSCVDGRTPSRVVQLAKMPHRATASYFARHIIVSQWHIENGLTDSETNAQMYCAILHEHEHISQFTDADNGEKTDEKTELFRKNIANMIPYSDKSLADYMEYRFQPLEYHAHQVSEEGTKQVFKRLEQEFGTDQGFEKWFEDITIASIDNFVRLYNMEYASNYSFEDIYQSIIAKISSNKPRVHVSGQLS